MSGFASTAGIGLNPATLAATGGLSALLPVATGAIGGTIGFFKGKGEEDAYDKQKRLEAEQEKASRQQAYNSSKQYNQADATNRGFLTGGTQQSSFYGKNGGVIRKEGGELHSISKNTKLAVGQSHENGGIKLDAESEIEGGETLVDKGDHTLVVSDNLVNPMSGNTFAKDDLKLAKSLSKFEGKTSNLAKNSIKQINAKREILHNMQQKMNGDNTDEEQNQNMAENGMKLNNIGIAGQGNTSEDITYKADIPIAGRPSPIRFAPKEVKKLNMLSKPVQYPVPLKPQVPNYAKDGMKMYKNGGEITDEEIGKMADYEEANKGGKGGGSNWGTNNANITTREQAIKYYKDNYLPKIKNFPKELQKRAFQQAVNTGDPYGMSLTAAGIYDDKGTPSKNSGLKDSRSVNRGLNQNENIYTKRLSEINTQYEKDPKGFTERFDKAVDYHYSNATQKGSQIPLNKAYPNFYEGYTKMFREDNKNSTIQSIPSTSNMKTTTSGGRTYTGGSGTLYNVNTKGEKFTQSPKGQWVKTDKFPDSVEKQFSTTSTSNNSPVDFSVVGKKDNTAIPSVNAAATVAKPINRLSSTLQAEAEGGGYNSEKPVRDYSSLKSGAGSLAKLATYTAPAIMDYANQQKNIARLRDMKTPEAPQQGFVNLAKQNMEVDKADIRKQQANYNAGLSGTLADSQSAALMKANIAEKSASALAGVNQAQRNANVQTANQQTELNMGIDARNKAGKYGQAQQQLEKDVDISNRTADVNSKLMSDFRNVQNTYRQEKYADAALDVDLAGMSDKARAEFDRSTKARGHYGRYIVKNGGKLSNLTKSRI
jgi:hypothetical protein